MEFRRTIDDTLTASRSSPRTVVVSDRTRGSTYLITASPASTSRPRLLRPMAAVVAALLALGSMALLYLLAGIPEVEYFVHVRFVLGPDGFMRGSLAVTLAWLAAPAAAAVCAWVLAPRAARREPWAGAWMGVATYPVTLMFAAFVPDFARAVNGQAPWVQSIFEGAFGAPIVVLIGGPVLGPLLAASVLAGSVWAWIVGRIAYQHAETRARSWPFDHAGLTLTILVGMSLLTSLAATVLANLAVVLPLGTD